MTNAVDVNNLLKLAIYSVDNVNANLKRKLIEFLGLYLPESAIELIDIDKNLSRIENIKFDDTPRLFKMDVEIDGTPTITIKTVFQNGKWQTGEIVYQWCEVVIDKNGEVIGVDKRNTFRDGKGGFMYAKHEYSQDNFMLALGEATLFAKKVGTYNDNY